MASQRDWWDTLILRRMTDVAYLGMPKRISNGPSDVNQAAFLMAERATSEPEENPSLRKIDKADISRIMSAMGRKGGKKGGKRSLETMTPDERRERALRAAKARWGVPKKRR